VMNTTRKFVSFYHSFCLIFGISIGIRKSFVLKYEVNLILMIMIVKVNSD
jgi:hypothetical protein